MNLKNGIKEVIGFIVRNELYNKDGFKKTLESLKNLGKMKLAGIVNETAPKQEIVEYPAYVVSIPKGILWNIWEFHSIHGNMREATRCVEKDIIGKDFLWSKHRDMVKVTHGENHVKYEYDGRPIASVCKHMVKFT